MTESVANHETLDLCFLYLSGSPKPREGALRGKSGPRQAPASSQGMLRNLDAQTVQLPLSLEALQKGPSRRGPRHYFSSHSLQLQLSLFLFCHFYFATMMPVFTSAVERASHTLPCVPGLQVDNSKTTTEWVRAPHPLKPASQTIR